MHEEGFSNLVYMLLLMTSDCCTLMDGSLWAVVQNCLASAKQVRRLSNIYQVSVLLFMSV
jgi:hypothetical protein